MLYALTYALHCRCNYASKLRQTFHFTSVDINIFNIHISKKIVTLCFILRGDYKYLI